MKVAIFRNSKESVPQVTELDRIAYMMQFSRELCERTEVYRQLLARREKQKAEKMKTEDFPAFVPNAVMNVEEATKHLENDAICPRIPR